MRSGSAFYLLYEKVTHRSRISSKFFALDEGMAANMPLITKKLHADYDSAADVLYFVYGSSVPGFGDEGEEDIVLRYALSDDLPIGATIIGYKGCGWETKKERLSSIISKHLSVPQLAVIGALESIGL